MDGASAELRLRVPFVEKAEIDLKKIGLELIVRVGGHKRNIVLPSALASFRPREAKLEGGALRIRFARQEHTPITPPCPPGRPCDAAVPDDPFAGLGDTPHDPFSSWEDRPPPGRHRRRAGPATSSTNASPSARSAAQRTCCVPPRRPSSRSTGTRCSARDCWRRAR